MAVLEGLELKSTLEVRNTLKSGTCLIVSGRFYIFLTPTHPCMQSDIMDYYMQNLSRGDSKKKNFTQREFQRPREEQTLLICMLSKFYV